MMKRIRLLVSETLSVERMRTTLSVLGEKLHFTEPSVLAAGRSKSSYLLVAKRKLHIFVWSPRTGAQSTGITLRFKKDLTWHHHRVILFQRNGMRPLSEKDQHRSRSGYLPRRSVKIRRTLTVFEYSCWLTSPGVSEKRIGTKGYVRLKIALPGSPNEQQ